MALRFVPFEPAHLDGIDLLREEGIAAVPVNEPEYRESLARSGIAWTLTRDGVPLGSAGIVLVNYGDRPYRGECWMLLARALPAGAWPAIARFAYGVIDGVQRKGVHRIEAHVHAQFWPGQRFVRMLGFKSEGIAERYSPDGADFIRYARVRWPQHP